MAKPLPEQVFSYLAFGLAKYTESERKYPYPPELLYAQHHLALAMRALYPVTATEFFELCKEPIEEWWPGGPPTGVDPRFELLTPTGELDSQVIDYLTAYKLPDGVTPQQIQVILDNQLMVDIMHRAKQIISSDPVAANREYTAIRQYVITHPWTNNEMLRRQFRDLRYIKIQAVGELYQACRSIEHTLLYQQPGMTEECYWNCSACGPLYQRNHRLGSIKPDACKERCPGLQGWQQMNVLDNTLVLKRGIHLLTHIPGVTEIQLYHWLTQEVQPGHPRLQSVSLWPGVDCYDLQLVFQKSVWAVDVKDYKDPFALGRKLKNDERQPAPNEPQWQEWFYVYPSYRERQRPNYRECVLRTAGLLPPNVTVMSEKQFKMRVLSY